MKWILYLLSVILLVLVILGAILLYLRLSEENSYRTVKNQFELGLYEGVADNGIKFLSLFPKSKYYDEINYYVSYSIYQIGKYDIAKDRILKTIQKFLNKDDHNELLTRSIELLGDMLRNKGESIDPSLESYLKTALIRTTDEKIRKNLLTQLGYIYFHRKEYNNALLYFQASSGEELAELGKARVYIDLGEYQKAFYIYDEFMKYKKDSKYYKSVYSAYYKQLYNYAFNLMKKKEYDKAAENFARVVQNFKGTPYEDAALYWLGEIYAISKKYDKSIEFFNRTMSNGPKNKDEDALFKKSIVLYQAGKLIDAVATFRRFIIEYPNSRLVNEAKRWADVITKELQYVDTEED